MMGWMQGLHDPGVAATLIEFLIKGAVILLVAEMLTAALRRSSAALRHLIWTAAILAVLALPLATRLVPAVTVPLLQRPAPPLAAAAELESRRPSIVPDAATPDATSGTAGLTGETPSRPASQAVGATGLSTADLVRWSGLLWATGAALILARLVVGAWSARRLAATAQVAGSDWQALAAAISERLGLKTRADLLISDRTDVPMAWGITRPVVVLPSEAEEWDRERRQLVLVHELAHVKRRDCLTQLAAQTACALYWMNPLTWRAAARLRTEREMACDDVVITTGTRGSEYAKHLLEIAQQARGFHPAYGVSLPMARPSQLEGRLLSILNAGDAPRHMARVSVLAVPVAALALLLPIAALQPWAVAAPTSTGELAETRLPARQPVPTSLPQGISQEQIEQLAARLGERLGADLAGLSAAELAAIVSPLVTPIAVAAETPAAETSAAETSAAETQASETRARVRAAMIEVLQSGDKDMRADAAHALGSMEDTASVDPLVTALADSSADVRANAAWALGMIESPEAVPGLLNVAGDSVAHVRSQAVWALGMIESEAAVGGIGAFVNDESADVRANAAWALGMIEDPTGVGFLAPLVHDSVPAVRSQATWALGMIQSAEGVALLLPALQDEVVDVRVQAAWALGMIESSEGVAGLIAALGDGNVEVRSTAIWALGMIEDPAAIDALLEAMKDPEREVQRAAMNAIAKITG